MKAVAQSLKASKPGNKVITKIRLDQVCSNCFLLILSYLVIFFSNFPSFSVVSFYCET